MTLNEFVFGCWLPTLFGVFVGLAVAPLVERGRDAVGDWRWRRSEREFIRRYRGER